MKQNRHFQASLPCSLAAIALGLYMVADLALADELTEKDYLQDLPVVLSASRLSQPFSEAPNAMTVIDRAAIKDSGFRNIADLFRLVPGMYVSYVSGHTPIVAYHGATDQYSRRMQVLVDGRSVYLPPTSSVSWEDLPLHIDDIERIEVVRGPAAASHGANSFQGVINIITTDASAQLGSTRVAVTKGGGGVSDASVHTGKAGSILDYRITAAYRADDGFGTNSLNDGYSTRLINLRANYHPGSTDSIDFQLGYSEGTRSMGIMGRVTDPYRDAAAASNFQQLTWLRSLQQKDEFKLSYYHIHQRNFDRTPAFTPDNTYAERHELEAQHTMQLGGNHRLVWGGGVRADYVDSPLYLNGPQTIQQTRLFAHDEWRISSAAILNAGAMFENNGMGRGYLSPRFAFNYHVTPKHTLRAGVSVAYRNPATLEEKQNLPGQFFSLGGLKPEKIISREIGYLGEFDSAGLSIDARTYYDRVSDVIFIDPSPLFQPPFFSFDGKPYSFRNLLSTDFRGAEASIKRRWDSGSLTLNYARQIVSCSITGTLREPLFLPILGGIAAECTQMAPWDSGSILWSQQLGQDTRLSAGYYHQERVKLPNTYIQPPMRRVDLKMVRTLRRSEGYTGGEVALVVQNAFRDSHAEYGQVPQTYGKVIFDRRAYVTASFNF